MYRGLRIAYHCKTSNAEVHADIYIEPTSHIAMGCRWINTYPMASTLLGLGSDGKLRSFDTPKQALVNAFFMSVSAVDRWNPNTSAEQMQIYKYFLNIQEYYAVLSCHLRRATMMAGR